MNVGKFTYVIYISIVASLLVLSACAPKYEQTANNTSVIDIGKKINVTDVKDTKVVPPKNDTPKPKEDVKKETPKDEPKVPAKEEIVVPAEYKDITLRKTVTEGDKIELKPEAVDYDGDKLTYTFTKPLDGNGLWQTKEGDEGFYPVEITASDGKSKTSEKVLLIVLATNRAPILTCPKELKVKEGETVSLDCTATDKEGDDILITYSGWMTSKTKKTGYDDAGTKKVTITASDGKKESTSDVTVIIENSNRAPEITGVADVEVTEGEAVKIVAKASDPDADPVTLTFGKPLDANGVWKTVKGDAGEYDAVVTASDGKLTTKKTVKITVNRLNSAPVITKISDIVVEEGDTVTLAPKVTDPDGDKVEITISGWMEELTKITTYDDAGVYTVKVTASDGTAESDQDVKVTVKDKNRPPVFRIPL